MLWKIDNILPRDALFNVYLLESMSNMSKGNKEVKIKEKGYD